MARPAYAVDANPDQFISLLADAYGGVILAVATAIVASALLIFAARVHSLSTGSASWPGRRETEPPGGAALVVNTRCEMVRAKAVVRKTNTRASSGLKNAVGMASAKPSIENLHDNYCQILTNVDK
jgi:hypothetical protein